MSPIVEEGEAQAQAEQESQEAQAAERARALGKMSMNAPEKQELYAHIARAEIVVGEAMEILGRQRDALTQQMIDAVEVGEAPTALRLGEQIRELRKVISYLHLAVPPHGWGRYLPAVQVDWEDEQ
jgi:hypothetical protein